MNINLHANEHTARALSSLTDIIKSDNFFWLTVWGGAAFVASTLLLIAMFTDDSKALLDCINRADTTSVLTTCKELFG